MGLKSQRKGRAGELELTQTLRDYGFPVKPGIAQSYGTEPDLYGLPKIHVEVKRRERTPESSMTDCQLYFIERTVNRG